MPRIVVNITAANTAVVLLFGSACFHSCAKYFYSQYRLVFGTLFPAYSSYKAVKNRDVREYVSIDSICGNLKIIID